MDIEEFYNYCLAKPGVTEDLPFDDRVLVFKVLGKVFALTDLIDFGYINLKCDPLYAIKLREKYDGVIRPGYHMNKRHWNSVDTSGLLDDQLIRELIDHSYHLVRQKLSKKEQKKLEERIRTDV